MTREGKTCCTHALFRPVGGKGRLLLVTNPLVFLGGKGYNGAKTGRGSQMDSGRPVRIELATVADGRQEAFMYTGFLYRRPEGWYVRYDEEQDDGRVSTILKVQPNRVVLLRRGARSMEQVFVPGAVTSGTFSTPYGRFALTTHTRTVDVAETEDPPGLVIRIAYAWTLGGEPMGERRLTVMIKEGEARPCTQPNR